MTESPSELEVLLEGAQDEDGSIDGMAEELTSTVLKKNRQVALRYLCTRFSERMVLLPQCLRSTKACQAEERDGEYFCAGCGACKIAAIVGRARELGYMSVKILKGGSALARMVRQAGPKAVLGVACPMEGVMGILACQRLGVPAFCVPLLRDGCADTDVDLKDVMSVMEAALS